MNTKRHCFTFLLPLLLVLAAPGFAQDTTLTMGGGFTGGTFNVFVEGMIGHLTHQLPGLSITAVDSAGSIENLQHIMAGELDMALAFGGDSYLAFNGFEIFDDDEEHPDEVRAVGYLYSAVSQLVTLEQSGIKSFADLVGKRIAVGAVGSGTHLSIERLLRQADMLDDVSLVYVAGTRASEMLKDGEIDAYHVLLGVPNTTVLDSANDADIHMISILDVALRAGFFDRYPFYSPYVITSGSYPTVNEDVLTLKDAGIWVVSASLDDDLVYELTKTMFSASGLDHMNFVTEVATNMGLQSALLGIAFPLHPGAARFWAEVGVEFPANVRP